MKVIFPTREDGIPELTHSGSHDMKQQHLNFWKDKSRVGSNKMEFLLKR